MGRNPLKVLISFSPSLILTERRVVTHMAKSAKKRLVATFHNSPPSGEKNQPSRVRMEQAMAQKRVNLIFLLRKEISTTAMYGTPPAIPSGSRRSTEKTIMDKKLQITTYPENKIFFLVELLFSTRDIMVSYFCKLKYIKIL